MTVPTPATPLSPLTCAFEAGDIDPSAFGHEEHVRVAIDMLKVYGFVECAARYANSIKSISIAAGVPEKFNMTITLAFLSLIAERLAATPAIDCDSFIAQNPELLSKTVLEGWYTDEQLHSEVARQVFLLPQKAHATV